MRNKLFIFIPFIVILFSTCKKYPDDPFVSVISAKMRLQGHWTIKSIKINEVDVTSLYTDSLGVSNIKDFSIRNETPEEVADLFNTDGSGWKMEFSTNKKFFFFVDFNLTAKKRSLFFLSSSTSVYAPGKDKALRNLFFNGTNVWKILRLYGHQLIFEKHVNNIRYEISYE